MMQVSGGFGQGFTGIWFILPGNGNSTWLGAQVREPRGLLFVCVNGPHRDLVLHSFTSYSKSTFNV